MARALNPAAAIQDAQTMSADALLDTHFNDLRVAPFAKEDHRHHHVDGSDIRSFSIVTDDALDWTAFGVWLTMLLNRHGDRVLRVKGILNVAGSERPVAIHGVQRLVHSPVHMSAWPDEDRRSRLVFILSDLDPALVQHSFDVFQSLRRAPALAPAQAGERRILG
ncbi:GTP-binding protein [Devosia aurantiaca]|uniref:GTP-binding protein n=1 Tax=Devosia aurantiaca TaxID=2714858 RepID=UPI0038B2C54C